MNNRLALLRESVEQRLDAIRDPSTGKGLFTSGRISGLEVRWDGKVSFTLEAPPEVAEHYVAVRDRADAEVRKIEGVRGVTAVLTAHGPKPQSAGGIGRVKHVIAVASAKGGVGKSTVAVNLACSFAALGHGTGLLDLDVYGPSAPTLLGTGERRPQMSREKVLDPLDAHGLKTMSIGYLVDPASPMIWRGAMATSAVRQMIDEVAWGELDVLVLDMPPGTGDVQVTLVQRVPLAGAIIVSTPQEMALADVRRGLAMFEKTRAPILGVIENMAYFETADGKRTHIFGEGGARRTAEAAGAPFLGEIPIDVALRESCDAGVPLVAAQPDHPVSRRILDMAQAALANVARLNKAAPRIQVK
ncbi:MAG TPA: Mrp/NBP35 family ATP-binding protein [Vitreimonas sp.]|uniref:Mrp/NBP35 family ATP-binding protein n=1 Tax=Vitreimonas sp. TaxID=3069702 RepID=UPI002D48DDEA|nr:Mrp/NBP35 family ATP-binding protein [Vitreimonas sp.]HYD89362.1 Mrp/NBP35 family ATP-binding protein [Vitreimonas sp.]